MTARFVIVGGGTAGWITAFIVQDAIRRKRLDASVTVVEPSKIPTVGVGEATTAAFYVFLKTFGIDEFDLCARFRRVREEKRRLHVNHQRQQHVQCHRDDERFLEPIELH